MQKTYTIPEYIQRPTNNYQIVENLAAFLMENTGSVLEQWAGKMTAKDQRLLFGHFLGKGTVYIDGSQETIAHSIKVCFGTDFDITYLEKWHKPTYTLENISVRRS